MFQNKSSSFGVRPRATGRQTALSNENSTANSIKTRSQVIKDATKDIRLNTKPTLLSKQVVNSKFVKPLVPQSKLSARPQLSNNGVISSKPKVSLSTIKDVRIPKQTSSIPSVVITRSRSLNGGSSDSSSSELLSSKRITRPVRKIAGGVITSKTSALSDTKDISKSAAIKLNASSDSISTRKIAKPSSLYSSRRSQFSNSSASLNSISSNDTSSSDLKAANRGHHRSNTSTSSVIPHDKPNRPHSHEITNNNDPSLKLTSSNIKLSSLRISSSDSHSTIVDNVQWSEPSQNMDVDSYSEKTNVSETENEVDTEPEVDDEGLLIDINENDYKHIDAQNSLKEFYSPSSDLIANVDTQNQDAITYALSHTGLSGEVPITISEVKKFESDVDPFDTSLVPEYSDDIFLYMRELEDRLIPSNDYMDRQPELAWSMRCILVDWLVQVHDRFRLLPETLFLAINFVDRFLSIKTVKMHKLQLVGAVCLLLAAKYEEIQFPSVSEIVYMTENAYTSDEVTKAERYILRMLNFDLGWPGPMSFLRRISKADDYDISTRTLSKYLLEVTLMDEHFINVPPSKLAAISHYLSLRLLSKGSWTREHAFYSGYFESEISVHLSQILKTLMHPKKHQAIFDKYSDRKYMRSSEFVAQWFQRNDYNSLLEPHESDFSPL
ncbi:G2/mitotic-specific cyclin-4 [Smittium mucronatum]|uniref:G2/mitotic-specific cyclin-4 n=1 Tax=Smittium mucronatum TaxID=133383 RepID=A0A1R0H3N7_9FUNG|nr:G2/mitotic-specific cyclin-4 [Smittium mucronatum]